MSGVWRFLCSMVLALLLAGCDAPAAAPVSPVVAAVPVPAPVAGDVELGRKVYNFRCYFCHGYSGDARTLAASYLSPRPRDFTTGPALSQESILRTLHEGRAGTAMKPFKGILNDAELRAVAAFVESEFVQRKAPNTAYHTEANGWPDHQRFRAAFPFVRGEIQLDAPAESLNAAQQLGRQLYLGSCISCHDRAHVSDEGPAWSARPLSYPRMGFLPGQQTVVDAVSSASVYAKHDVVPAIDHLSAQEKRGEALFQANCAFCHGADGTGKNWIGQFMEPKARDLTAYTATEMTAQRLQKTIREGLPGTSMPAWQHVLQPAEIQALSAYVRRAFVRPAGG